MATEDDSGTLDNIPLQKGNALDIYSITHSSSPYLTDIQHIRKEEQEEELVNSNLNKQASNETSDKDCFLNTNLSIKATQGINGQIVHEQLPQHMLQQSEDEFKKVINYYNPLFYHSYSLPYWCEPEKSKSSNQKDSIFIDKNKSKSYLLNEQNLLIPSPSAHMKDVEITVVTLNQLSKKTKTNASEGDQNGFNQVSIMPKINEKGQLVLAIDKNGTEHLLLCEYNQLSCKIVNSKQISSRREDDPDVDVITIEDYINETSQEIEFTEIKEKQRQAIQELNEHHNYSKPSCLSLQADSKDVYIWAPRFSSGIPIVVDESLSPNRQISPVVNESLSTNRDISPFIENQAIPSVRQCSWSMENCTNRQRRKNLKELIQERQNLEILIRQNWKATKTSRVTIPNNLEHVFGSTPIETINKLSRNNDIDRESLPTPTPKKIVTIIRSTNHNVLERESRRKMADLFTGLKHSIPKYSDKKQSIPKIKILQEAEKYIISLTKESSDLEHEKEKLQRQNFLLNEYLKHCHSEDVITVLPLT
ncbi:MYCN [Mytilus edulis]|uniref:NMYC n=1 Tax=Mytilus edulis TaxID=6550 RepID=A0A8S3TE38_MYTED|nr:MYCN [Mytilus edulis]